MAIDVSTSQEDYERLVRDRASEFERYLRGVLGGASEGRGGRVGVQDTLQEGLLKVLAQWPELSGSSGEERERRLYRCLRDAAGEALRREHGRREASGRRMLPVAYDFASLEHGHGERSMAERELTTAVLGAMARDIADGADPNDRRGVLDRAVLLAGLRALTETEAVVMLAVDRLDWDQEALAAHLELDYGRLREILFVARKLFYGVVRHGVGVELDEEERARLHAYLAGELSGRERRMARRHVQHCDACQAFMREQRVFGRDAHQVLTVLPIAAATGVLHRSKVVKATAGLGAIGGGLLGQAGAAKALGLTAVLLGTGVGISAALSVRDRPHHGPLPTADLGQAIVQMHAAEARLNAVHVPATTANHGFIGTAGSGKASTASSHHVASTHHATRTAKSSPHRTSTNSAAPATASSDASTPTSAASPAGTSAPPSSSSGGSGGGEFLGSP